MSHFPRAAFPFLIVVLGAAACHSSGDAADFAKNDLFYVDVPFQTKAPGDRAVFVAPIADARDPSKHPLRERGFPITYGADDFWERPIGEMVGEVLVRQLQHSQLFTQVSAQASPDSLVMKPTLVEFVAGATEAMSGSSSFAEVGVQLVVLGPADAAGARAVLHDQLYRNRQVSPVEVNPVHPFRLVGRALQVTMSRAMTGLDGSNIARSHVPVDPLLVPAAPAAEASAAPR